MHLVFIRERADGTNRNAGRRARRRAAQMDTRPARASKRSLLRGSAQALRSHRRTANHRRRGRRIDSHGQLRADETRLPLTSLLILLLSTAGRARVRRTKRAPRIFNCTKSTPKPTTHSGKCPVSARTSGSRSMCSSPLAPTRSASPSVSFANNAFLQRWRVHRDGGLRRNVDPHRRPGSHAHRRAGPHRTARRHHADRSDFRRRRPRSRSKRSQGSWEVARAYLALGVEHILLGIDHLLFVLALMILVRGAKRVCSGRSRHSRSRTA